MRETGVRHLDGREFLLAGRGTKESCQQEAVSFKRQWQYVRIMPYGWGNFGKELDDYGIWVNARKT